MGDVSSGTLMPPVSISPRHRRFAGRLPAPSRSPPWGLAHAALRGSTCALSMSTCRVHVDMATHAPTRFEDDERGTGRQAGRQAGKQRRRLRTYMNGAAGVLLGIPSPGRTARLRAAVLASIIRVNLASPPAGQGWPVPGKPDRILGPPGTAADSTSSAKTHA